MKILNYLFDGPFTLGTTFNNVAGIYIVCTEISFLDVGQTEKLGERLNGENHDRKQNWIKNSNTLPIYLWFHHETNLNLRLAKEKLIRNHLRPICGAR